jgi:3D (Asp-Asp-Asp) domain-containing protein
VLGQAHPPRRRLFGITFAACAVLALPATSGADPSHSAAELRSQNASLASRTRSVVLSLYALDSELASAKSRLSRLEAQAATLRRERAALTRELEIARTGARLSQQRLAARVRLLFDHGETSAIEILFGAQSLDEALTALDNLDRVASINRDVLAQLRAARGRIGRASTALARRERSLDDTIRAHRAATRALEAAHAERTAYIADLRRRHDMNTREISALEAQSHAAQARALSITAPPSTPAPISSTTGGPWAATAPQTGRRTMTVSAVAYSLPGHTASGLPVGLGVVAVDPRVIPLGTRMVVPGYGPAVAADTGSAIIGPIIDLWFPTLAQAQAWGRRSVTITLD